MFALACFVNLIILSGLVLTSRPGQDHWTWVIIFLVMALATGLGAYYDYVVAVREKNHARRREEINHV